MTNIKHKLYRILDIEIFSIMDNELFESIYVFYEIYTCKKYFVISMYIFESVLNFTNIIMIIEILAQC